ncbi:MAG: helix-turn-helix domain-containing protein [Eubacteriales bacterium]
MVYTFEEYFGEGDRPRISAYTSLHKGKVNFHTHTFHEMVYVLNGFSLHFCGGRTTLLTAGDMFIIAPGVEHSYANPYRNGVLNFMFCLEDFIDSFDPEDELPCIRALLSATPEADSPILHVDIAERRSIENTFEKIRLERRTRAPGWRTSLRMRMVSLLLKYSRMYETQYGKGAHSVSSGYSYVLRILQYVEKNYADDISMEQLAKAAGLNADYMSRRFKAAMGMSPSDYVRKFRVAKAMELLGTTDMTVAGIASACGFSDVCLFSRVFKNITGVTPVEFRKNGILDLE